MGGDSEFYRPLIMLWDEANNLRLNKAEREVDATECAQSSPLPLEGIILRRRIYKPRGIIMLTPRSGVKPKKV